MQKKYIGIDFDLTGWDSLVHWFKWCNDRIKEKGGKPIDDWFEVAKSAGGGDLVPIFKDLGVDNPFAYWEQSDLYDDMEPMCGFVNVVKSLIHVYGYNIRIISKCVDSHKDSKVMAVYRHFKEEMDNGLMEFYVSAEKTDVEVGLMIDDYPKVVKAFNQLGIPTIQPRTPLTIEYAECALNWAPRAAYRDLWVMVGAEGIHKHYEKHHGNQ